MKLPPILTKMANPVIKLEPIRMGSLVSDASAAGPGQKYVPPNLRTDTGPIKIDLDVHNFPCLGAAPRKTGIWGKIAVKPVPMASPVPTASPMASPTPKPVDEPNMKDMIKEQIRQAELEEEERQKPKEEDPLKMTREELLADGWVILPLNSANEARLRLNTRVAEAYVDSSEIW